MMEGMASIDVRVAETLETLRRGSSAKVLADMGPRYGIRTARAFGVPMGQMKQIARQIGTDHHLAVALWDSEWYEARVVAALIDDPAAVTADQMESWCASFDNWAICDTVCFNLFDRTAHAWAKVDEWAGSPAEYVKRTAFALLWSLALHDRDAPDAHFSHGLALIEREAHDDRNFVTKSLSMALRAIAHHNPALADSTIEVAQRLVQSDSQPARTVGARFLREQSRSR